MRARLRVWERVSLSKNGRCDELRVGGDECGTRQGREKYVLQCDSTACMLYHSLRAVKVAVARCITDVLRALIDDHCILPIPLACRGTSSPYPDPVSSAKRPSPRSQPFLTLH